MSVVTWGLFALLAASAVLALAASYLALLADARTRLRAHGLPLLGGVAGACAVAICPAIESKAWALAVLLADPSFQLLLLLPAYLGWRRLTGVRVGRL